MRYSNMDEFSVVLRTVDFARSTMLPLLAGFLSEQTCNSCVIPVDDPYEELCQAGQVCSTSLMRYSNMDEFSVVLHLISQAAL